MKNFKKIVTLLLILAVLFSVMGCNKNAEKNLWDDAIYTEDTDLGQGSKVLTIVFTCEEKTITFTINTDKQTVGEALFEHSLIEGDQGAYGLYVKKVNGITADYDVDQAYWGFFQNGEYMMTGVDTTNFESGQSYELIYTKG